MMDKAIEKIGFFNTEEIQEIGLNLTRELLGKIKSPEPGDDKIEEKTQEDSGTFPEQGQYTKEEQDEITGTIKDQEQEKTIENFSEYELELIKIYKGDAEEMLEFIRNIDYVGEHGIKKEEVASLIKVKIEMFWGVFLEEIIEEGEFSNGKKNEKAFEMIKEELTGAENVEPADVSDADAGKKTQPQSDAAQSQQSSASKSSQGPVQVSGAPDNLPIADIQSGSEKFSSDELENELRKIRKEFEINVQGDQIIEEEKNKEVVNSLWEAFRQIGKDGFDGIEMVVLQKKKSSVISKGKKINLKYDIPSLEMADELKKLISKAKEKWKEGRTKERKDGGFYDNQFIKGIQARYPDFLPNFEKQLDEDEIPIRAQLNLLEVFAGADLLDGKKLSNRMLEGLASVKFYFYMEKQSKFPDEVENITENFSGGLKITFGSNEKSDINSLGRILKNALLDL